MSVSDICAKGFRRQRSIKINIALCVGKTCSESLVCFISYFYWMTNFFWSTAQCWMHALWGKRLLLLVKSWRTSRECCKIKECRVKHEMILETFRFGGLLSVDLESLIIFFENQIWFYLIFNFAIFFSSYYLPWARSESKGDMPTHLPFQFKVNCVFYKSIVS